MPEKMICGGMALKKNDIIDNISQGTGLTKKKSIRITESLLEVIKSTLETGEDVLISGFGRFCVKEKRPRRGRNPATGESMILPARREVTFKCSGKLRGKVNGAGKRRKSRKSQ